MSHNVQDTVSMCMALGVPCVSIGKTKSVCDSMHLSLVQHGALGTLATQSNLGA